jgi:hypothetical protein
MILDIKAVDPSRVLEGTAPPDRRLPEPIRRAGYIPHLADLKVGDLVLYWPRAPRWRHRIIRNTQLKVYNETQARFVHAAVYLDNFYVCEAVGVGVRVDTLLDALPDYRLLVRRPDYKSGEDEFKVAMRSLMRLRQGYNYRYLWSILLHALGGLHKDRFPGVNHRFGAGLATICSMLYADSFAEATGRTVVSMSAGIILPADLAASTSFNSVAVRWRQLPKWQDSAE